MDKLLNERDALQSTIQAPFTEEEKVFGQELLPLEKELNEKLKALYEKIFVSTFPSNKRKRFP